MTIPVEHFTNDHEWNLRPIWFRNSEQPGSWYPVGHVLWTSPMGSKFGWKDLDEHSPGEVRVVLEVDESKLWKLDESTEDSEIREFVCYSETPNGLPEWAPDFERIRDAGYRGIWLTYPVLGRCWIKSSPWAGFKAWDVETVLILDDRAIERVVSIERVKEPVR